MCPDDRAPAAFVLWQERRCSSMGANLPLQPEVQLPQPWNRGTPCPLELSALGRLTPGMSVAWSRESCSALLRYLTGTVVTMRETAHPLHRWSGDPLSGCDGVTSNMRHNFSRLTVQSLFESSRVARRHRCSSLRQCGAALSLPIQMTATRGERLVSAKIRVSSPPFGLVGWSEVSIRAPFGAPTNWEDRTPGKSWRYRRGQCALDVSLDSDVQPRQLTTLAYEVRSDDSADQ